MNKNKYMDEIEELNVQDIASESSSHTKKSSRKTIKSFFIIILSILCIIGIVLIHKLHNESITHSSVQTRVSRIMSPRRTLTTPSSASLPSSTVSHFETETNLNPTVLPTPGVSNETTALVLPETTTLSTDRAETSATPIASVGIEIPETDIKPNYSLRDALIFKEHFLKGITCNADYNKLMAVPNKTRRMQSVLNNLSPFCSGKDLALDNIREAFLKDKKRALIANYQAKNPQWLAYIKALFVSVIEVRRLNPTSTKPKDIIYKAQNELYRQNIAQAEKLLRTLPIPMQEAMNDFFREAEIYMRADESLNELILSFEGKGE